MAQLLKPQCDEPLCNFAFKFNLRRYTEVTPHQSEVLIVAYAGSTAGPYYADYQGTSNGGRQFLRRRRQNRHVVPLYGKSDHLFARGLKFEML